MFQNIELVVENNNNAIIQDIINYNPRFAAYQAYFLKYRKFGAGHLTRLSIVCIDFLLRFDVTRKLTGQELVSLDQSLATFFDTEPGKSFEFHFKFVFFF